MSENLKRILEEFEKYKGQFVITILWKIERLVAVGDDGDDYYYITYNGRDLHWNSCVGRIMPLKGYLRDKDYNELVRIAKLNHYDQLIIKEEFDKSLDKYLSKYSENEKILTDFCWDLE
jgi:hypothetical protein